MDKKCPCCNHELKSIFDYPKVELVKFERYNLSDKLVFPDCSKEFFSANQTPGNVGPLVPKNVLDFFKKNRTNKEFEDNGFVWVRNGPIETGLYQKTNRDVRNIIINKLNPYFDKLEKIVGNISTDVISPPFECLNPSYFRIPETSYNLFLLDLNDLQNKILENYNIFPKINAESENKLAFIISKFSGIMPLSSYSYLACVGALAYNGVLNK